MNGLYFRKVWQWDCRNCGAKWLEDFAVKGKDLPIPKCEVCGNDGFDGKPLSGEWAAEGCLSVKGEVLV
jgi:hypothetical protein